MCPIIANPTHEDPVACVVSSTKNKAGQLVGRTVRLRSEVVTRAGVVIAKGTLMTVAAQRGSRLALVKRDVCPHCRCGSQYLVRGVNEVTVEVLP